MSTAPTATLAEAMILKAPELSCLIRDLRELLQLTQIQLAAELGVTYETVNHWENGLIKPSPLALRQLGTVLYRLHHSPCPTLKHGSKRLLNKYFSDKSEA